MKEIALRQGLSTAAKLDPHLLWAERGYVLGVARAIVVDLDLAEDVAQEVLLKALRERAPIRNLRPYLRTLTVRVCLNHLRRRRIEPLDEATIATFDPTDERLRIEAVLRSLPVVARAALLLSVSEGLSYAEIATELGIPEGTVASRIHTARNAFKELWNDHE